MEDNTFQKIVDTAYIEGVYIGAATLLSGQDLRDAPLSGEWADDPLPHLIIEDLSEYFGVEIDPDGHDEILDAWESGYQDTERWYTPGEPMNRDEMVRRIRDHLNEGRATPTIWA